jgi:RNA-splicing ligase RtcB
MIAVETTLDARYLPDNLKGVRDAIERAVPHGRTNRGGRGDRGAWFNVPDRSLQVWAKLKPRYDAILEKHADVIDETPAAYKPIDAVRQHRRIWWKWSIRCARWFA